MKTVLALLVVIIAVLVCGCTASAPSGTTASPSGITAASALPNLTGTWTGPMQGYVEKTGFTNYPYLTVVFAVTEQHGRLFSGYMTFTENGTQSMSGFAGVIGRDNRTFTLAEKDGGYSSGEMVGPDEMEITYLKDGTQYSAVVDSFKRV
jgi:hypothetical protein